MSQLHLKDNPTLKDLQEYIEQMVAERGFSNSNKDIPKRFMLLMEEIGEFARAARGTVGMKFAPDTQTADQKSEAADVLIVFLSICNLLGIDLEQAVRNKEEQNKKRTWYKA